MKTYDLLLELELLGTEQNQKVYRRHGVKGYQFGVSFANLRILAKKIGKNTPLAEMLWCSGVHDARVLAAMVTDPEIIPEATLDRWVLDLDNYILTDVFSGLVSQTEFDILKANEWICSSAEWVSSAGWNLVAQLALQNRALPDDYFCERLRQVETKIQHSPNRTRYSMNNALIAVGIRNEALQKFALAAAHRIGKVQVDHGETACKTPDASTSILKTNPHQAKAQREPAEGDVVVL